MKVRTWRSDYRRGGAEGRDDREEAKSHNSARTFKAWLRKIKKTGAAPLVQAAITKAEQETDGYYASVKEHFPDVSESATMLCDVLNCSD